MSSRLLSHRHIVYTKLYTNSPCTPDSPYILHSPPIQHTPRSYLYTSPNLPAPLHSAAQIFDRILSGSLDLHESTLYFVHFSPLTTGHPACDDPGSNSPPGFMDQKSSVSPFVTTAALPLFPHSEKFFPHPFSVLSKGTLRVRKHRFPSKFGFVQIHQSRHDSIIRSACFVKKIIVMRSIFLLNLVSQHLRRLLMFRVNGNIENVPLASLIF